MKKNNEILDCVIECMLKLYQILSYYKNPYLKKKEEKNLLYNINFFIVEMKILPFVFAYQKIILPE